MRQVVGNLHLPHTGAGVTGIYDLNAFRFP